MKKIKLFKMIILINVLIYSFVLVAKTNERSELVSSLDSSRFNIVVFFTKDLKFSNNFLTKPELPKVTVSNIFKTDEVFELVTIFKKFSLDKNEAKIVYGIKISDPDGKDYYVNSDLKFSQKNLTDNGVLLIDPKHFVKMKFEHGEAKGLYRVYVFAVDVVSKERVSSEVFIEHK